GVIGLLFFNTSMQQASFRETALSRQARDLDAQQEALQLQLDALRDPQRIARLAQRMGMIVPAGTSGILDFRTGRISGTPVPAEGPGLPLRQASATPPAVFAPAKAGTTKAGTAGTAAKSGRTSTRHGAPTKNR
ncbi:MAG TPA: hypothetical protein VN088_20375, partial [Nocardioides sp.]|nr:hypothetical protein [Nocardioides sp.]